eukprot:scaffold1659_cov255-Pinguiococcus_pyrenoidosus.AAC.20
MRSAETTGPDWRSCSHAKQRTKPFYTCCLQTLSLSLSGAFLVHRFLQSPTSVQSERSGCACAELLGELYRTGNVQRRLHRHESCQEKSVRRAPPWRRLRSASVDRSSYSSYGTVVNT